MKRTIKLLTAIFVVAIQVGFSSAAVYTLPTFTMEGSLKGIYSDFFTILTQLDTTKSSDANQVRTGELSFNVDGQTQYDNVDKLTDLKEGDKVRVDYRRDESTNIANLVTKLESADHFLANQSGQTTTTITTTTTVVSP